MFLKQENPEMDYFEMKDKKNTQNVRENLKNKT